MQQTTQTPSQAARTKSNLETVSLYADDVRAIRSALLIGLDSYGEIERLTNQAQIQKMLGKDVPEMRPIHPTGAADTVSMFALALRTLEATSD